jgi:phage terminase large subunit-like protein
VIASLTPEEREKLSYEWRFWARDNQLAPDGDWRVWLLLAGRGFGKTRAAVEWIRERVDEGAKHLILAGATAADVRDIMIEGESGVLATAPSWMRPHYEPSKSRLTWPNGARATLISADEPERFRGKQCDTFWADELASWRYPEAWDQLVLGFRLGVHYGVTPRGMVSTTPRPTQMIRALVADKRTVVTRGSTYDNIANLADEFVEQVRAQYEGTRLGRQELHAEILEDVADALWSYDSIATARKAEKPQLTRIVVAVDPSGCSGPADKRSDEVGISVCGLDADGLLYILEDASGRMGPQGPLGWGAKVCALFRKWNADHIVCETNYGGAMVAATLSAVDPNVPVREVTASRGKHVRAEPVSVLFAKGRAYFVGMFKELEEQLVQFSSAGYMGKTSPDRADAMVWGAYALGVVSTPGQGYLDALAAKAAKYREPQPSNVTVTDADLVLMRAPAAFAKPCQYQAQSGRNYYVEDGHIRADPRDVTILIAAGFSTVSSAA